MNLCARLVACTMLALVGTSMVHSSPTTNTSTVGTIIFLIALYGVITIALDL